MAVANMTPDLLSACAEALGRRLSHRNERHGFGIRNVALIIALPLAA